MKVLVFDQQADLPIQLASVQPVVHSILTREKCKTDEVSIYFVSTAEICRLHQDFFNDPSPTDCISFPLDQQETTPYHILGEVFICPKTALDYVLKGTQEVNEDCYRELTLYLIHGLLHLLGYDDQEDEAKKTMRAKEKQHMQYLIEMQTLLKKK